MAQSSEPLMCHPMPNQPLEVIGTDLFSLDNYTVLITVDYFSGFWEVDNLTSTTLSSVIHCLCQQFARYGEPVSVCSDNGPQFSSAIFSNFSGQQGFVRVTSSPGYPQSNGKAKCLVKTAKRTTKGSPGNGRSMDANSSIL